MREARAAALECLIGYATTGTEFTIPGLCSLLGYSPSSGEARAVRDVVNKMRNPQGDWPNEYRVIEPTGTDSDGRKTFRANNSEDLSIELRPQLDYNEEQYARNTSQDLPPVQLVGRIQHLLRRMHWKVEREREEFAAELEGIADELREKAKEYWDWESA